MENYFSKVILVCLFLTACSDSALSAEQEKQLSATPENPIVESSNTKATVFEKVLGENTSLSTSEVCMIFFPENNIVECESTTTSSVFDYKTDNSASFEATFSLSEMKDFSIKVSGINGKTPFQNDERNWGEGVKWVSELVITFNKEEVLIPTSAYADLSFPTNIEISEVETDTLHEVIVRFKSDQGDITQFNLKVYNCEDFSSYSIFSRVVWVPRMYGDSYQKTTFRTPLCN